MGASQRRKGAQWERDLAKRFRELYPEAKRGIGQARSAKEVSDVEGTPWWVEAKCGKKPNVRAALEQAKAATDGRPVLVIVKDNNKEPFVAMPLSEFLEWESVSVVSKLIVAALCEPVVK